MGSSLLLILPACSAALYALASLLFKRGFESGAGKRHAFHLTNLAVGLTYAPLYLLHRDAFPWSRLHEPALTAATFYLGGWLSFLALRRADVSIVTPLLGTKAVFVAAASIVLLREVPSLLLWSAAVLTAVGILIMNRAHKTALPLSFGDRIVPISAALAGAACFGISDVFVRKWAPSFGPWAFLPAASVLVALASYIAIRVQGLQTIRKGYRPCRWLVAGALLTAAQAIGIGIALSFHPNPTAVNIVYASRALWTIALVWLCGSFLDLHEIRQGHGVLVNRLAGSLFITGAIVLAVLDQER
ncbi:MAG TPA: EamA family transporter [Verrucomicrobiales bacterium]|nr:EamA family transporter [Verrucomicrobiales bacterium]